MHARADLAKPQEPNDHQNQSDLSPTRFKGSIFAWSHSKGKLKDKDRQNIQKEEIPHSELDVEAVSDQAQRDHLEEVSAYRNG